MIMLSNEQIKRLHKKLLDATGGLYGVRDEAMLDSACAAAFHRLLKVWSCTHQ